MANVSFLLRGLLIGFSIAATVGPISVLCIQRTLERGRGYGLVSGMGAASADALYGAIASFGLTFVTQFLVGQQLWIRLIGGCFLVYLGLKTLWSRPIERTVSMEKRSLFGAYTSTFLLTLTTMLTFVGVFAGVGLGAQTTRSYALAAVLVLGVFLGSALWWLLLSTGVGALRVRFNAPLRWVNRISGGVLVVFGVLALLSLVSR